MAAATNNDDLIGELADLQEVILCLMAAAGVTAEMVEQKRITKNEKRGSFKNRVFNTVVEMDEDNPSRKFYKE